MTAAALEEQRHLVEEVIGRPLRLAERAIDVLTIDQGLNAAKDEVEEAIRTEMIAAARRTVQHGLIVRMHVTRGMLRPLDRLFTLGRREAYAELQRIGLSPTRGYVADPKHPEIYHLADELAVGLNGLSVRVHNELVEAYVDDLAFDAIARALLNLPGARFIAAEVITRALTSGLNQTFEANQDLVGGWEYTAVLDGGTCDPCGELDGTTYPTWDAIQEVLPDGGPNPSCDGGNRCRCRPVPTG